MPTSVVLGTDPVNGPRYYYVYNGHGDVVALTDATGTVVASYSYDVFGVLTSSSENFPNNTSGWTNPYRYDGRDGVRYDGETGLYWMSVRAYDPTLGRFLQHDPLGRASSTWVDQPYVYGGNDPLLNVDPNGQWYVVEGGGNIIHAARMAHRLAEHPRSRRRGKSVKGARTSPDPGGFVGGDKNGVPPDALFKDSSQKYNYTVYLGKRERDGEGWHYNFHIRNYRSKVDRANWHLRPPTQTDTFDYQWYFYDDVEIDGKRNDALVVKLTLAVPWPDLEAIEEPAFAQFISRAATLATSNPVGQNELFNRIGHDPEVEAAFKWLVENGKYWP